jgi:hypothetical protein
MNKADRSDSAKQAQSRSDKPGTIKVGPNQVVCLDNYVDEATCSAWLSQVLANQDEMETRFEFIHSYGSSWYLDIEHGLLAYYHANAEHTNELLHALPNLVETLADSAKFLEAPDGSTGLPSRPRSQNLGPYWANAGVVLMMKGTEGVIHADYEGIAPYPPMLFDPQTRAYSAVISLATAASGGNLMIWKSRKLASEEFEMDDSCAQEVAYSVGSLSIFDSFCYHRIMASKLDDNHRFRAIAAVHFLYLDKPYPHFEYWF